MENTTILGGQAELAIGSALIPAYFLGDITPEFTEGTRETASLAGSRTSPSGVFETATLTFTLLLPSMDYLKNIFADVYNAPSGAQTTGNLVFGGASCQTRTGVPVNVHYTCDDTDDNDLHIFSGIVGFNYNPTYNADDGLAVEVTVHAQPTSEGYFRLGTGDLTAASHWDHETQATVANV